MSISGAQSIAATLFGALILGGVHLAAWRFDFPTQAEQILWRAASLFVALWPVLFIVALLLLSPTDRPYKEVLFALVYMVSVLLYVVARLALIVESVRSLYYLPTDAFRSTWGGNFPHFG
jgi:hypothetical protein